MAFIDEVKQAQEESHQKWFDRWVENNEIKKEILISAKKGYKATVIDATERGGDTTAQKSIKNRIKNPKTVEMMKEYLGEGFEIKLKRKSYKNILGNEYKEYSLLIGWEGEK